jgi:hypothetical protein
VTPSEKLKSKRGWENGSSDRELHSQHEALGSIPSIERKKKKRNNLLYLAPQVGMEGHIAPPCFLPGELFVKEMSWMLHQQKDVFASLAARFQKEGEAT